MIIFICIIRLNMLMTSFKNNKNNEFNRIYKKIDIYFGEKISKDTIHIRQHIFPKSGTAE